jgi:hypothetical protein
MHWDALKRVSHESRKERYVQLKKEPQKRVRNKIKKKLKGKKVQIEVIKYRVE